MRIQMKIQLRQTRIVLLLIVIVLAAITAQHVATRGACASPAQRFMAESPATMTLIRAGRLLDPRTGNVLSPAAVLIENGKIKEVGAPARLQADAPAGVKTIDLGGAT